MMNPIKRVKRCFHFSNILRNTLPSSSVICRWGGDEFAGIMTGIHRDTAAGYITALYQAADEYNRTCSTPSISFAAGYALSTEHPGRSRKELLQIADDRIYQNKQAWYTKQASARI